MIICICKKVSDIAVRQTISNGADSLEDLKMILGVCTQCQKCKIEVCRILIEVKGAKE